MALPRLRRNTRMRFPSQARSHLRARLVRADHGTMELGNLLGPAIEAAEQGYPITERVARHWAEQVDKLRRNPTAAKAFLFHGAAPQPGTVHRQPELAAALRSIAAEGPTAFYGGWIARDMVEALRALGGLHRASTTSLGLRRNMSIRSASVTTITVCGNVHPTARA